MIQIQKLDHNGDWMDIPNELTREEITHTPFGWYLEVLTDTPEFVVISWLDQYGRKVWEDMLRTSFPDSRIVDLDYPVQGIGTFMIPPYLNVQKKIRTVVATDGNRRHVIPLKITGWE